MRKLCLIVISIVFCCIQVMPSSAIVIYKDNMPDFNQTSTKYGHLPGGGKNYCAPAAASNVFIWLAKRGFKNLAPNKERSGEIDQFELIKILASKEYMKTNSSKGTTITNAIKGIEKYVMDKGYRITIERAGQGGYGYHRTKQVTPAWIANGLLGSSNVLVNLGWYSYNKKTNTYERIGGHFVTVVGVKENKLIIHDPASTGSKNDFLGLSLIKTGKLKSNYTNSPISASGFWKLNGIKSSNQVAIIDGAVRFKIYKPQKDITIGSGVKKKK